MLARAGGDRCAQLGMDRHGNLDVGLALLDRENAVPNVLTPHAVDVAAALTGADQQHQSEPLLAPDRVLRLELRDLNVVQVSCPSLFGS